VLAFVLVLAAVLWVLSHLHYLVAAQSAEVQASEMATLYLLADEPVQDHRLQDCRLIVEVHAPDGADISGFKRKRKLQ